MPEHMVNNRVVIIYSDYLLLLLGCESYLIICFIEIKLSCVLWKVSEWNVTCVVRKLILNIQDTELEFDFRVKYACLSGFLGFVSFHSSSLHLCLSLQKEWVVSHEPCYKPCNWISEAPCVWKFLLFWDVILCMLLYRCQHYEWAYYFCCLVLQTE